MSSAVHNFWEFKPMSQLSFHRIARSRLNLRYPANLLRHLCLVALAATIAMSADPPAHIHGVLIDRECSGKAELRIVPGPRLEGGMIVAEAHTRECARMPQCQRSGYGVFTYEQKFLPFDEAGNRMAIEALEKTQKLGNLQVEVTGELQGDQIKVTHLQLL
jgi:hypothetical protein